MAVTGRIPARPTEAQVRQTRDTAIRAKERADKTLLNYLKSVREEFQLGNTNGHNNRSNT